MKSMTLPRMSSATQPPLSFPELFFCAHQPLDDLGEHLGLASELGFQRGESCPLLWTKTGSGAADFQAAAPFSKKAFCHW